tara:strand:- start:8496 stop:9314 length:819 start_codon:yes stop_codon:yes gene_type:complete
MDNSTEPTKPEFYVGYLPTPPAHRRFIQLTVAALTFLTLALAVLIARAQRDPGASLIPSATIQSWTGTLYTQPYPMLIEDDGSIHLVMGMGKFGVADRVAPFKAKRCIVEGWALARSDRQGIQLAPESNAIRPDPNSTSTIAQPALSPPTPVRLFGEIVDGKCFIGAMKPGDGKAHKSCAILCIGGGLPPMFESIDPTEFESLPLILVNGQAHLPDQLLQLAGEPVIITANLQSLGPLPILNIHFDPWQSVYPVQRWTPALAQIAHEPQKQH